MNLKDSAIRELAKFTKTEFEPGGVIEKARKSKCINGIKTLLQKQVEFPDDDFVRFFFKELYPENHFTGQLKEDFIEFTTKALDEFINDPIRNFLDDELLTPPIPDKPLNPPMAEKEFTEDEKEGYYMVKSILSPLVSPSRITHRDTKSYCNVLLDDNGWKQIVRFHFNNPDNKRLEIYSMGEEGNKISEKVPINDINDIYQYSEPIKAMVTAYESR